MASFVLMRRKTRVNQSINQSIISKAESGDVMSTIAEIKLPQLVFTLTITNRLRITFRTLIPAVWLRPLNLLSASSVNIHGLAITSIFHNNLRAMLSPLKSTALRKYSNPFKRPGMYSSLSKCNAKRYNCCMHLCTNSTVT